MNNMVGSLLRCLAKFLSLYLVFSKRIFILGSKSHSSEATWSLESTLEPSILLDDETTLGTYAHGDLELNRLSAIKEQMVADPAFRLSEKYRDDLLIIATKHDFKAVKLLLNAGANIDYQAASYLGRTALAEAIRWRRERTAQYLIHNKASIHVTDERGWSPLHYACYYDAENIASLLIQSNADTNCLTRCQSTPLNIITGETDWKLIDIEPSSLLTNKEYFGAWKAIVKLLLQNKSDPNIPNLEGNTPLFGISEQGNIKAMRWLLQAGALPSHKNKLGMTALDRAVERDQEEIVNYLVGYGAATNLSPQLESSLLRKACIWGNASAVRSLLMGKADVNLQDQAGNTPLNSFLNDSLLTSKLLLDGDKWRCIIKILLEHGADLELANYLGNTPLMTASEHGPSNLVNHLVDSGAKLGWEGRKQVAAFAEIVFSADIQTIQHMWSKISAIPSIAALDCSNVAPMDNALKEYGKIYLLVALWNGQLAEAKYLLQTNAYSDSPHLDHVVADNLTILMSLKHNAPKTVCDQFYVHCLQPQRFRRLSARNKAFLRHEYQFPNRFVKEMYGKLAMEAIQLFPQLPIKERLHVFSAFALELYKAFTLFEETLAILGRSVYEWETVTYLFEEAKLYLNPMDDEGAKRPESQTKLLLAIFRVLFADGEDKAMAYLIMQVCNFLQTRVHRTAEEKQRFINHLFAWYPYLVEPYLTDPKNVIELVTM